MFSVRDRHLHSLQARHWHEGCGTMSGYHHPMGMPEKKNKITSLNKWEYREIWPRINNTSNVCAQQLMDGV